MCTNRHLKLGQGESRNPVDRGPNTPGRGKEIAGGGQDPVDGNSHVSITRAGRCVHWAGDVGGGIGCL